MIFFAALLGLVAAALGAWACAGLVAQHRRRERPRWRNIVVFFLSLGLANIMLTALYLIIHSGLHYSGPPQLLAYQYLLSFVVFVACPTAALVLWRLWWPVRLGAAPPAPHLVGRLRIATSLVIGLLLATVLTLVGLLGAWPPILYAARNGHPGLARALLNLGANPDAKDRFDGMTPLTVAVGRGDRMMVLRLLEGGADVNARDGSGATPLMATCWKADGAMAELLLQHRADPGIVGREGQTALMIACSRGDAIMARMLLKRLGSRADAVERALVVASERGEANEVGALLARLTRRHTWSRVRWERELLVAASEGLAGAVTLALEEGTDPNSRDAIGATPLILAARAGAQEAARTLADRGADIGAADHNGTTALMACAERGRVDVAHLLLDRGAQLDQADRFGHTALMIAARAGQEEMVRLLLEGGASRTAVDSSGRIAADLAREAGRPDLAKLVAPLGMATRGSDLAALTPGQHSREALIVGRATGDEEKLLLAINRGDLALVRQQLAQGYEVNRRSPALNGGSALLWAAACDETEIAVALLEHGADVDGRSDDGVTPLMEAAKAGSSRVAGLLLAHGAEVNARTRKGWSALMWASEPGNIEVAELLVDHGAALDARNARGETALSIAERLGRSRIVALLRARGAPH